jgi:hypothetical protein
MAAARKGGASSSQRALAASPLRVRTERRWLSRRWPQVTVNNQIVIGTLMNICDNPNVVSVGQDWGSAVTRIRRTPIIVTGAP